MMKKIIVYVCVGVGGKHVAKCKQPVNPGKLYVHGNCLNYSHNFPLSLKLF